ALRGRHQEVHKEDVGGDSPAAVVLGGRAQPDLPQRKQTFGTASPALSDPGGGWAQTSVVNTRVCVCVLPSLRRRQVLGLHGQLAQAGGACPEQQAVQVRGHALELPQQK
ncbi:unnamed protein product, partial [Tetraodon nigroviridis]